MNETKRAPWAPIVVGALVIGGAGFMLGRGGSPSVPAPVTEEKKEEGGDEHKHEGEGVVRFDEKALTLANLGVETAAEGSFSSGLVLSGEVDPNLSGVAKVTPRVAGKVVSVLANVGDSVRTGQTLAIVSSTELAKAQAAYREASARLEAARTTLARQRKLADLGAFGRPRLEESRSATSGLQADLLEARGALATAQAEAGEAEGQVGAARASQAQAAAQTEVAQSRLARSQAMYKEQLVSRQDLEQAQADAKKAEADAAAARASIVQAQARLDGARARAKAGQGRIGVAQARLDTARQQQRREEAVFRGGYATSKEVVDAETAVRQADLETRAAADAVRLLGGTAGGGSSVAVTAPIAGRVTERAVSLGETVPVDRALFTLLNARTVWVQLSVPQASLPQVGRGTPISITSESAPGRRFQGTVSYVGDVLDENSRTAKVRCAVDNAAGLLRPGMFVSGKVVGSPTGSARRSLTVPADAVQDVEGKKVVFVPGDAAGEFVRREVEVGEEAGGRMEILSGLKPGERYVAKNAFTVKAQSMKGELGEE